MRYATTSAARAADEPGTRAVVLDAESDAVHRRHRGHHAERIADDLGRDGIQFVVARDIGQVRDLLSRDDKSAALPAYSTIEEAVEALSPEQRRGD